MAIREWVTRLKERMGWWFWVLLAMAIPTFIHEADHIVGGHGLDTFPVHSAIDTTFGTGAAFIYHDASVVLGGFTVLLLLYFAAKPYGGDA